MAKKAESTLKNMLLSLTLIAFVASLALALVNNVTKGPIEKVNQEKVANAIKKVLPEGVEYTINADTVSVTTDKGPANVMRYTAVDAEGNTVGKAIESFDNNGFGGKLTEMVGIGADGAITGVKVTDHADTPGVGTKAHTAEHLATYKGLTELSDPSAKKENMHVSGASVSSNGVHYGIYGALKQFEQMGGVN